MKKILFSFILFSSLFFLKPNIVFADDLPVLPTDNTLVSALTKLNDVVFNKFGHEIDISSVYKYYFADGNGNFDQTYRFDISNDFVYNDVVLVFYNNKYVYGNNSDSSFQKYFYLIVFTFPTNSIGSSPLLYNYNNNPFAYYSYTPFYDNFSLANNVSFAVGEYAIKQVASYTYKPSVGSYGVFSLGGRRVFGSDDFSIFSPDFNGYSSAFFYGTKVDNKIVFLSRVVDENSMYDAPDSGIWINGGHTFPFGRCQYEIPESTGTLLITYPQLLHYKWSQYSGGREYFNEYVTILPYNSVGIDFTGNDLSYTNMPFCEDGYVSPDNKYNSYYLYNFDLLPSPTPTPIPITSPAPDITPFPTPIPDYPPINENITIVFPTLTPIPLGYEYIINDFTIGGVSGDVSVSSVNNIVNSISTFFNNGVFLTLSSSIFEIFQPFEILFIFPLILGLISLLLNITKKDS